MPVALRDVARKVTSTRGKVFYKMPCVRSLPKVDATTVSVLEAAGMPTIEHVLAFVPSELRADPRVEQVRLPPLTARPPSATV